MVKVCAQLEASLNLEKIKTTEGWKKQTPEEEILCNNFLLSSTFHTRFFIFFELTREKVYVLPATSTNFNWQTVLSPSTNETRSRCLSREQKNVREFSFFVAWFKCIPACGSEAFCLQLFTTFSSIFHAFHESFFSLSFFCAKLFSRWRDTDMCTHHDAHGREHITSVGFCWLVIARKFKPTFWAVLLSKIDFFFLSLPLLAVRSNRCLLRKQCSIFWYSRVFCVGKHLLTSGSDCSYHSLEDLSV